MPSSAGRSVHTGPYDLSVAAANVLRYLNYLLCNQLHFPFSNFEIYAKSPKGYNSAKYTGHDDRLPPMFWSPRGVETLLGIIAFRHTDSKDI